MFGPLKTLFERQLRREAEDAEFLACLDPARTATLGDLMADVPSGRIARLRAPWLDVGRLVGRLASACLWLEGVAREEGVKGWEGIPLTFFQAGSSEADAAAHQALLDEEAEYHPDLRLYTKRCGRLPPAIHYLPTHTKIATALTGTFAARDLRLRPQFTVFSNYADPFVYDAARAARPVRGRIVGYQMTDLAALLGVSRQVATDVFARVVVHDLLHGFLPSTPFKLEGFHNVAALQAMGTLPTPVYGDAWERLVHMESVDPGFCLRAGGEIAAVRRAEVSLSPVQEDHLSGLWKWYASPTAKNRRYASWDVPSDATEALQRRILLDRLRQAKRDGFRLYLRFTRPR